MQLLSFTEIPPAPGEVQKDGARRPVRATYTVTKAGEKTKRDGEVYDWPSLRLAAKDEWLQEEILCQTLVCFLGHPPDLIDINGKNWGSNPWVLPKVCIPEGLWADEPSREIRSTVRYLPNKAGLDASDDIRAGKELAVSMVSFKRCDDEKYCEILKIVGFDQVKNPNMPSALLLSHKDSADHKCESCQLNSNHNCNKCNKTSADASGSAHRDGDVKYMRFKYKDKELLLNKDQLAIVLNKDMMTLGEILGQAKGYGVTQEGVAWLEYWCAAVADMQAQLSVEPAGESEVAEMSTDSANKLSTIETIGKTMKAAAATKDGRASGILNGMADQLIAFKKASDHAATNGGTARQDNPPVNGTGANGQPQNDSAMQLLTNQVTALTNTVVALTKDNSAQQATAQAQKDAAEQIKLKKDGIDKLFEGDSIIFNPEGRETVIYQRKSFTPDSLQAVKDGAMMAPDLKTALFAAELAMDGLSRTGAGDFLKGKGYAGAPQPAPAQGRTNGGTTAETKNIADHPAFVKLKTAQDAFMRQNDWSAYEKSQSRDSVLVKEKKADLLKRNMPKIEAILAKVDQLSEEKRSRGKDAADDMSLDDYWKMWPVQSQKDSVAPIVNNATTSIILPTLSAYMMYQEFESCDAMNLYRGITKEGLTPGIPTSSPGWGRVFNFGQEFGDVPSGTDPYVHLNERGTQVFEEIGLETTRQEFVAQDYGLVIRIGRGDAMAMLSGWPPYDILARLKFRAEEYLNRMRNARMYRALFDAADQVGAIARAESVQNVGPAGTGPRDYTGEYKQKVGDVAIVIGGKSFGGVGSNIDAVCRVRGSDLVNGVRVLNATNTAHANVPIARNYLEDTHSSFGIITKRSVMPASVTIGAVLKVQGSLAVVAGVQMIVGVGAQWAMDQDGFIVLAAGAGQGVDPTAPQIITNFQEVTNFIRMNVDPGSGIAATFYNNKLFQVQDAMNIIRSAPNYGKPDTVLSSNRINGILARGSIWDKQQSPNGTMLNPFDSGWNRMMYRGTNYVATTDPLPFGDNRSLILQSGYAAAAMWMDGFSQPYRGQKADLVTGQIQILPQLLSDMLTQDAIGVPIMTYPATHALAGQTVNFPMKTIINYGNLPANSD